MYMVTSLCLVQDCSLTLVEKTEVLERKDLDSDLFQVLIVIVLNIKFL